MAAFEKIVADPAFGQIIEGKAFPPELSEKLSAWTADALSRQVLQIEQNVESHCSLPSPISRWLIEVKTQYLARLGLTTAFSATEQNYLFRGLLFPQNELAGVKAKIESLGRKWTAANLLSKLFGRESQIRGVLVLGGTESEGLQLERWLEEICEAQVCPFWNATAIFKVALTKRAGLALYVPEFAVLGLSEDIFKAPENVLKKIVLLHELSHAGDFLASVQNGSDWTTQFMKFSGWAKSSSGKWDAKVVQLPEDRRDLLTKLSKDSDFSLLPDRVFVGKKIGSVHYDGFVTGRSYLESLHRQDLSEDLADHIAVFRWLPERFCFSNQSIAPRKFAWIKKNLFPRAAELVCEGKAKKR